MAKKIDKTINGIAFEIIFDRLTNLEKRVVNGYICSRINETIREVKKKYK